MSELYKKIKQITIVGSGSWGTAVGKVIAENNPGTIVRMWSYEKATANSINLKNQNSESFSFHYVFCKWDLLKTE